MAIFNTNEFLRKTFSKTIFGTAALRPEGRRYVRPLCQQRQLPRENLA